MSGVGLGYIYMGRILLAQGDLQAAAEMHQKAEHLCVRHTVYPDLLTVVQVFQAQLLMEKGDLEQAWHVLEYCLVSPCCQHEFHREWVLIAQARLRIRLNQPSEAFQLLDGRLEPAWVHGRGQNWLSMICLSALAYHALGERDKALAALQDGLAYGQQEGFLRAFVDEGEPMQLLLKHFHAQGPQTPFYGYIKNLLGVFQGAAAPGERTPSQAGVLVEPLSRRELEVLHLMCEGLSNREIANRLVLSVGTVKTHIHHIFGKMEVHDRPQAIAKAFRLNL
jgi:LuxR family transcriptional regulator, maltose regulon positive regulatory protein